MSESPVFWDRYQADLQREHVRALSHIQHLRAALQTAQALSPEPVIALVLEFATALEAMSEYAAPGCYACVRVDGKHVHNCPIPMLLAEAQALGWTSAESE